MSPEKQICITFGTMLVIYFVCRWYINVPVSPDPWDESVSDDDFEEAKPICTKCSAIIEDSRQNYCPKCNYVTGQYTRYLPFENIAFNYSIFGNCWKNLTNSKVSLLNKFISLFLILICAPIMFVAWPFSLIFSRKKKIVENEKTNLTKKS